MIKNPRVVKHSIGAPQRKTEQKAPRFETKVVVTQSINSISWRGSKLNHEAILWKRKYYSYVVENIISQWKYNEKNELFRQLERTLARNVSLRAKLRLKHANFNSLSLDTKTGFHKNNQSEIYLVRPILNRKKANLKKNKFTLRLLPLQLFQIEPGKALPPDSAVKFS